MTIKEKAVSYHINGYNCAQAVLASNEENTELSEKTALTVSAGFGGGLRSGEICGAISGAVMALGMAFPFCDSQDSDSKAKIAALAKECVTKAQEKYDCVRCAELKGNIDCNEIIGYMADVADEIIKKNK